MDNSLKLDILTTVRAAMRDALEDTQEVWLTSD